MQIISQSTIFTITRIIISSITVDYEEGLKIIILISIPKAFKYRRYLIIFKINNKLYIYIRGRISYKSIFIFVIKELIFTSIVTAIIIIAIIIGILLIASFIPFYQTSLSLTYKVILFKLSIYRASSFTSLYNSEVYLIV